MRRLHTAKAFATTALSAGALLLATGASASASTTCDTVAEPNGSSAAAGTVDSPFKTAQQAIDALAPGGTACLRSGTYAADAEIVLQTPNTTLTSYPGERATLRGRVYVAKDGDGVTVSELDLDGRNDGDLPSPTINSSDAVLRNNDITNYNTAICVSLGSADTYGRAYNTLIEGNRIHNCGHMPATNQDHGIYINSSDGAVIRNNLIYDNADRGIQLYPDAQGTLVTGNVIDGNGQGAIFSGNGPTASSNNIVEHNVITNSRIRDNIDAWWDDANSVGTGNVVRDNCIGGGAYDDGDGGIIQGTAAAVGFSAHDNLITADPGYADRGAKDFSLSPSSTCGEILAGAPAPDTGSGGSGDADKLTISINRRHVERNAKIKVTGVVAGADRVNILQRRNGNWHRVSATSARAGGSYQTRIRARGKGREVIKAVSHGVGSSRSVKLKIKR